MKQKIKKVLLSIFILLNLLSVFLSNRPPILIKYYENNIENIIQPRFSYSIQYLSWLVQLYAYYSGLNNHWVMFGYQPRLNWWYTIKADTVNGHQYALPLPRQSQRTFIQKYFIDFKEAKFHQNLYREERGRFAYAQYLCQKYSINEDKNISSILYQLNWQLILPREEASRTGKHLDSKIHHKLLNEYDCSQPYS